MTIPIKSPRKLIEVALPLDAINAACASEKMPGIGPHPRGLHLWWARRPLAAARAIIFAQLVNDPGYQHGSGFKYGVNKHDAAIERKRLFKIIEELVLWKNTNNEELLERARAEIHRSWREVCELNKDHPRAAELFDPEKIPALHDPFAGGGAIPLEAQRLGLEAHASDLNPVAVLINKAMIEIPPKFRGCTPVGPLSIPLQKQMSLKTPWKGTSGLAEDVRRYGLLMREQAANLIGHFYPKIKITAAIVKERPDLKPLLDKDLTVIAWIWARTVKSPNPAFSQVDVPLVSTFILANKEGRQAYLEPLIQDKNYRFCIKRGTPPPSAKNGTKLSRGANFRCLLSDAPISPDYIKLEAIAGRMGNRLMAVVAEGPSGRIYLESSEDMENVARSANPPWEPGGTLPNDPRNFWAANYGLTRFAALFTKRQLLALTTLCDLMSGIRQKIREDAIAAGFEDDEIGLEAGGLGATAYSEAVSVYLAFALDRCADFSNSVTRWVPGNEKVMNLFGKQSIPMTWDYPEAAILADTVGGFAPAAKYIADCIDTLSSTGSGFASQAAAQTETTSRLKIISTDPPYYDNIAYADLSDFFYVWLRHTLKPIFPGLLATVAVPKSEELVATSYRHGSKEKAETFFLQGMTEAIHNFAELTHPEGPVTIYYAFKQAETNSEAGTSSTGWETFLTAVLRAGFAIVGTWPLRSEQEFRMTSMGNNALASSIVLVCRKRLKTAVTISRREFLRELNALLPEALDEMTKGSGDDRSPVAPVDFSQAIIGPGMAVFSKYAAVLEADGEPMSVRTALQLINRFLAEDDFDRDTQFCLHWFEQYGWDEAVFGTADTLARAKGTSVDGVHDAGVIEARAGKVRLKKWSEYPDDWNPLTDTRNPIWESLHHLIRALKQKGETFAGKLLASVQNQSESIRQLAYRLYTLCERQGWAEDARAYNELITSWTAIETAANAAPSQKQLSVFE